MKLHELESRISELMTEFEDESGLVICDLGFRQGADATERGESMSGQVTLTRGRLVQPAVRFKLKSRGD